MRCIRLAVGFFSLFAMAFVLTGCAGYSAASSEVDAHWVEVIRDIRRSTSSEAELRILEDYHVSDAELASAESAFLECVEPRWTVSRDEHGEFHWAAPTGLPGRTYADMDEVDRYCGTTSGLWNVKWLHSEMRSNPHGLTFTQLIRACYDRNNVPDAHGLSDAQFEELLFYSDELFIASTEAGRMCRFDPLEEKSLTIADLEEMERTSVRMEFSQS
jgi:hypothetical protein